MTTIAMMMKIEETFQEEVDDPFQSLLEDSDACAFWGQILTMLAIIGIGISSPTNFQQELKACLHEIFNKYFQTSSMLIYNARPKHSPPITRNLLPNETYISVDDIADISRQNQIKQFAIHNLNYHDDRKVQRYNRFKPQSSVFLMTEEQSIEWPNSNALFYHIKETEFWNRQARTLIIIHNPNTTMDMTEMAKNALAGNWRWNKAVNVVVMIVREKEFYFFLWFPYKQPDCHRITNRPINDIWKNGQFQENIDLYPIKITSNLNGCEVRIVTSPCVPYTYDGEGFEENLMVAMENHFNFTKLYKYIPAGQSLWITKENGTPVGGFGMLYKQDVDLAYGCIMMTKERYQLSETLPCFHQDSLSWFVPAPEIKSHADNIYAAFSGPWWMAIAVTTLICLLVFVLIVKLEEIVLISKQPNNIIGVSLRIFAMAISSPIALPSRTVLLRIFTFVFAMYSLHITTVYQASLYKLYRSVTYDSPYKTIEEAVDDNLLIWLRPSTKDMYNQSDYGLWNKILKDKKHKYLDRNPIPAFDEVALKKSAAVLFVKSTMRAYIQEWYLNEQTKMPQIMEIPHKFTAYPVSIFLSPGNPLFRLFSAKMDDIVQSGLIEYWLKEEIRHFAKNREEFATEVSLQLEHVGSAMMFQGVMFLLAFLVFLAEVLIWLANGKAVEVPMRREELNQRRRMFLDSVMRHGRGGSENRIQEDKIRFHLFLQKDKDFKRMSY